MKSFLSLKKRVLNLYILILGLFSFNTYAAREYNIGTTGNSFLDTIIGGLQLIVNAIGGPGMLFAVIVSFCVGWVLWTYKPDSKATMMILRVLVAALAVFNISLFLVWVQA